LLLGGLGVGALGLLGYLGYRGYNRYGSAIDMLRQVVQHPDQLQQVVGEWAHRTVEGLANRNAGQITEVFTGLLNASRRLNVEQQHVSIIFESAVSGALRAVQDADQVQAVVEGMLRAWRGVNAQEMDQAQKEALIRTAVTAAVQTLGAQDPARIQAIVAGVAQGIRQALRVEVAEDADEREVRQAQERQRQEQERLLNIVTDAFMNWLRQQPREQQVEMLRALREAGIINPVGLWAGLRLLGGRGQRDAHQELAVENPGGHPVAEQAEQPGDGQQPPQPGRIRRAGRGIVNGVRLVRRGVGNLWHRVVGRPVAEQRDDQRAQLERERLEQEERDRQAQLERERLEQEERDRQAQLERERLEQEERDRQAQLERERLEQEERDRQAQLERERLEQEERDRLAQVERDRQARGGAPQQPGVLGRTVQGAWNLGGRAARFVGGLFGFGRGQHRSHAE